MNKPAGDTGGFVRFRLDLAYDGTDFVGWAKQPGHRTVAGELIKTFEKIFGETNDDFAMRVAGRTDAGVHAKHQVCHLDIPEDRIVRIGRDPLNAKRLNTLLPEDVIAHEFSPISADFDARFSALGRHYRYTIADTQNKKDPRLVRYVLEYKRALDVALLNEAAEVLIGLHDFAAFCKPRKGASTIRNLKDFHAVRQPDGLITIEIHADAFCHNMVRALVGSIVAVADSRITVKDLVQVLKTGSRGNRFRVVSAKGLSLESVDYPNPKEYAKQADVTKIMRKIGDISV